MAEMTIDEFAAWAIENYQPRVDYLPAMVKTDILPLARAVLERGERVKALEAHLTAIRAALGVGEDVPADVLPAMVATLSRKDA